MYYCYLLRYFIHNTKVILYNMYFCEYHLYMFFYVQSIEHFVDIGL